VSVHLGQIIRQIDRQLGVAVVFRQLGEAFRQVNDFMYHNFQFLSRAASTLVFFIVPRRA
jgi:hypothetical protein